MICREDRDRGVYVCAPGDDEPEYRAGSLIPPLRKRIYVSPFTPKALVIRKYKTPYFTYIKATVVPIFMFLFAIMSAGVGGKYVIDRAKFMASPVVVVQNDSVENVSTLNYGVQVAFSKPDFYKETQQSFIDNEMTFLEADLTNMKLRYFKDGVLIEMVEILSKGKEGSWWETPAGLYEISYKKENHYSSFGHVYQPWSMAFQGNFFIHGWPTYKDGTEVPEGYSGGCIRLSTEDAERIYKLVDTKTPVLVYEAETESDGFVYEPKVPELVTPYYLLSDIESDTVLASSDMEAEPVPIASLTKLMTALVAAEYINLDKDVWVTQPSFVQSLIPRLGSRSRVSMYSLMQLLLVESSNEAAEVIAGQLGRERFIELMNEKAKAIGMQNTVFTDPSGLDSGNISTVLDLLRLTEYLFENRSFILELTANQDLPTAYVSGEFGELVNFNEVEDLDNFIGGKIGETEAAGQTSITLHRLWVRGEPRTLAIILLNSEHRNEDVNLLFNYALERFGR